MVKDLISDFTGRPAGRPVRHAKALALFAAGCCLAAGAALPPPEYIIGYYAPPPDWTPEREIADYTPNTRVPDLFWLKYDGAYSMALRIRPISRGMIEREIDAHAIDPGQNRDARTFRLKAERDERNRRIVVRDLNVPADDFVEFSFKMRSNVIDAGENVKVEAVGVGTLRTDRNPAPEVPCHDGFRAYSLPLREEKGRVLKEIAITLPEARSEDFEQEFVFIDFHFRRKAPKARFEDLPPRRWIRKATFEQGDEVTEENSIGDVCSFVRSQSRYGDIRGIGLPLEYEPLPEEVATNGHIRTKTETVKIAGREYPALRVTLGKGPPCYLRFPVSFDATDLNTISFYAKIDLPKGLPPRNLLGDKRPMLWGTDFMAVNSFFDTFCFGTTSATHDWMNWIRYGVSQGSYGWNRQTFAPAGDWTPVALDIVNDDFTGNKGTYNPKTTHWCFYYDCRKIPGRDKVVVSIADPRATRGLMLSGGEMDLYRRYLEDLKGYKTDLKSDASCLAAPETGRLPKPLPFIREGRFLGEIIYAPDPVKDHKPAYRVIVERALGHLNTILTNQYAVREPVPVLDKPSTNDNVKIFVGSGWYGKVDPGQYAADMKRMEGTPGCAIRSRGKNIYLYAAQFGYRGDARGLANAVYSLLENNTDVIMGASRRDKRGHYENGLIFDPRPGQPMDLVWGDGYCHVPPFLDWGTCGASAGFHDFNHATYYTVWGDWEHGGMRGQSCNHWWGYGTSNTVDETWGVGEDGRRMRPGCYTGHPCLVNVLERAKDDYLRFAFSPPAGIDKKQSEDKDVRISHVKDTMGLWVEDTRKVCQCPDCAAPIRLPDGSLVKRGDTAFLSTQFFANGCAMLNYLNVFARRDMRTESIGYMWMAEIPLFQISRNYKVRYCPYVRKNYMVPIFAPCNDLFWRAFRRWAQQDVRLAMYEYFLDANLRPWNEMYRYDLKEVVKRGLDELNYEGDSGVFPAMERWVAMRLMWDPSLDVRRLRGYYLRRTYREAAPAMERFFNILFDLVREDFTLAQPMEFEDSYQLGHMMLRNPSAKHKDKTVADDLTDCLDEAKRIVRNARSREVLDSFREAWDQYLSEARKCYPGGGK